MSTIDTATCPHAHTEERLEPSGSPRYGRRVCLDCGRFLTWLPTPMSPGRAAGFTLPFGRHVGETLAEVDAAGNRPYLVWVAEAWSGHPKIRRMARVYLESTGG